jgi:hypothetical protein
MPCMGAVYQYPCLNSETGRGVEHSRSTPGWSANRKFRKRYLTTRLEPICPAPTGALSFLSRFTGILWFQDGLSAPAMPSGAKKLEDSHCNLPRWVLCNSRSLL